jgi:hypothetical protein
MRTLLFAIVSSSFFGGMIWQLVFKKTSYPRHLATKLKVTHAIILFYVIMNGFFGFISLLFALIRLSSKARNNDVVGEASIDPALMLYGIAGGNLLFVCLAMANRKEIALKWFFIFWPLAFISSIYMSFVYEHSHYPIQDILPGMIFQILIFAITIVFYVRCSKTIFS